ncbi:hypothetical protein JIN87_04790 [Pelagicoccus mobilis]|uniref:Uncharacterized protein n=2 Tax=Pelagicoccus mobilis TaxID=415221 RepID=A0A934VNF8_9BACT|nr:hypothetical protein [Pelagicoccus mobilis]
MFFLVACDTTSQVGSGGKFSQTTQAKAGEGYVMFSVNGHGFHENLKADAFESHQGFRYHGYLFQYRSVELFPRLEEFGIGSRTAQYPEADFEELGGFGVVVCQAVPAGEYEIYGYTLRQMDYPNDRIWSGRLPKPITFTVEEGKITYLGAVRAENKFKEGDDQLWYPDGVEFSVSDEFYRDNTAGFIKWPYLMSVPFRKEVISSGVKALNVPAVETGGGSFF